MPGVVAAGGGAGEGGARIDRLNCAIWTRLPEDPITVTNALDETTEAAGLKVMVWGVPGFTCRLAGEAVIPGGRPVI